MSIPMRLTLLCAGLALLGCRARTSGLALAGPAPQDAATGATVIIDIPPPPPPDAYGVAYGAPLYIDPSAAPGSAGNGKPVPRGEQTPPDAALP